MTSPGGRQLAAGRPSPDELALTLIAALTNL